MSLGNLVNMVDNMAGMKGPQQPAPACAVQQNENSEMGETRIEQIWQ